MGRGRKLQCVVLFSALVALGIGVSVYLGGRKHPKKYHVSTSSIPRACEPDFNSFPFCNRSLTTTKRVEDLLKRLTLKEKVLMLTARASPEGSVPRLGVPEYDWGANCVHGVQSTCGTNCATSFPNPVNLGAIFDDQVVYEMAQVIGWELRALWLEGARENHATGPHLGLDCWSPNININRDPRWGRNMEAPSEDPLVNALYGVAYTKGLQEGKDPRYLQAVVTLKHWIAYSFERYGGVTRLEFDAKVSKYDFADTYFPAFRASVVDGKAKGVMCSYNSLNGVPTCSNEFLNSLLRRDLGFDGYVTSDSGAIEAIYRKHHYTKKQCDAAAAAITRGTDICSGRIYRECLERLVQNKTISEEAVNAAIRNTLRLRFELGLFDPIDDQIYWHVSPNEVGKTSSQQLSLSATRKSMILLRNEGDVLPLARGTKLAVLGPHATAQSGIMGNYLGQICHGKLGDLSCVKTPLQAIQEKNGASITTSSNGCDINGTSTALFHEAVSLASTADAVVLFLGIDTTIEREAYDRQNINLPDIQIKLLKEVRKVARRMIVVLFNGGAIGAEEIVLHCDALVEAFYPGFHGAQAIADVLFGDFNPSGKLPVTLYQSNYVDSVDMKSMNMTQYPGRSYRYFKEIPVFPFGWGLSYTTFHFDAMKNSSSSSVASSGEEVRMSIEYDQDLAKNVTIGVEVTNSGTRKGEEVVFAFFRPLDIEATGPVKLLNQQLFGYRRIELTPAARLIVTFEVSPKLLALVDAKGNVCVFPGHYEIILTNGVEEKVTFSFHLVGNATRILRPFPSFFNVDGAIDSDGVFGQESAIQQAFQ